MQEKVVIRLRKNDTILMFQKPYDGTKLSPWELLTVDIEPNNVTLYSAYNAIEKHVGIRPNISSLNFNNSVVSYEVKYHIFDYILDDDSRVNLGTEYITSGWISIIDNNGYLMTTATADLISTI